MHAMFLTGQSNRRSCQLSPLQKKMADLLRKEGIIVAPLNFPYDKKMTVYRETNLLNASLSNGLQYLFSRKASFAKQYRVQVIKQLEGKERCIVFAGSCGLELLNNLQLSDEILNKLHIIAYGPVARTLPQTQIITIQGRGDWLSRWFFKEVDHRIKCGHMDYLENEKAIALLLETVRSIKNNSKNEAKTH